jgi:hypothetical protein
MMKEDLLHDTPYTFIRLFKKGKQGIAGLVKNEKNGEKVAFKVSQHIDYVCEHEETVARRLNELNIPVFCKLLDSRCLKVNPDVKAEHPFIFCKRPILKTVLFFEYIKGYSLSKVIKSVHSIDTTVIMSSIKILILCLKAAYSVSNFTHYDLHTSNVIMKKCDPDKHILIDLGEGDTYSVPTHGYLPVVIDYGFSYIDSVDEGPMYQSLAHTDVGFVSCAPDPFADVKLFLASVSSHAVRYRRNKTTQRLRKIVRNIFKSMDIDLDCGWDINETPAVANKVLEHLEDANCRAYKSGKHEGVISELFDRYDHFAMDILGSLVLLPLDIDSCESFEGMEKSYRIFLKQFKKIENDILSSFGRLQALKVFTDCARSEMANYYNPDTKKDAVFNFQKKVLHGIDAFTKHVSFKDLNFEKLLCSMLVFSRHLEAYLSYQLNGVMNRKKSNYLQNLETKDTLEIFGVIDLKIQTDKDITEKTHWDCVKSPMKNKTWTPTPDTLDNLNTLHSLTLGTHVSKLISKSHSNE